MTTYNSDNNLLFDFESLSEAGIALSSKQIDRAIELSDRVIDPERQWQTYLNALALFGFETWLQSRDNLSINSDNCSVKQPSYASFIDGVFNLKVGKFKVCLLTKGVAIDEFITVPRAVIDLPEYTAHFYVLVNVIEEQEEVNLDSFIRHDEIIKHKRLGNLIPDADWTYELPLTWFNPETDDLLLYLRCLEPSALALPTTATATINIQRELESLLPQLQSRETALHEVLTWEQATPILSNPNLLAWLYELKTTQPSARDALTSLRDRASATISEVTQRVINVKSWLSDELDELAQNLAWMLLPAPAFAPSAFRDLQVINRESPVAEFEAIVAQLRNSGEDIPDDARGAYQDFELITHGLRLFAVTWAIEETEGVLEWNLLLILGAQPNNYLPQGLRLELREGNTVLDEKVVPEDTEDSYIYTRVIGELEEQFTISIVLANGESITFPDFAFD
ncbi:MAG: DUF1822 family protein [Xenococcus sp. MO_188.B8]|nr:DUF1822 family protein [Xenococcus sp. MO_188.B8]